MRSLTEGEEIVDVDGATVRQVINQLDCRFPGIKDRICQDDAIRPGLSVAVAGSIATLGMLHRTAQHDEIHFLPAIGGG